MAKAKEVKKAKKVELEDIFDYEVVGYTKPNMQSTKPYYTQALKGNKALKGRVVIINAKTILGLALKIMGFKEKDYDFGIGKVWRKEVFDCPLRKFSLPFIDVTNKVSGGIKPIQTCIDEGVDRVPVFICGISKKEVDKWIEKNGLKAKEV